MKKIFTLLNCAVCVLAAGTVANAASFNPEVKPLGSLGNSQNMMPLKKTVGVGSLSSPETNQMKVDAAKFAEKSLTTRAGRSITIGHMLPETAPQKEESTVNVNVTYSEVTGYEQAFYGVGIIDETLGTLAVELAPNEDEDEYDIELPFSFEYALDPDHSYSFIAFGDLIVNDTYKTVVYYAAADIVDGTLGINVDFNACDRKLAFPAYMGNGEPFPPYQPWSLGCGYNRSYYSQVSYADYYATVFVDDPMTFYVYCNELPSSAYYSIQYSANSFVDQVYCYLSGGSSIGGFEDHMNMVETIPASFYDNLSFSMSLSPADKEIGKESVAFGTKIDLTQLMDGGGYGLMSQSSATCYNDYTRQPVDNYQVYAWLPTTRIATGVQTSLLYTGFAAYNDDSKYTGPRTRVSGVEYILPWEQQWNVEKQTYTPFSSIDNFNIRPSEQDIQNFVYPMFATTGLFFKLSEDGATVAGASYEAEYYGMFHEKYNFWGSTPFKSFSIDGVEKELKDAVGLEITPSRTFDITFHNPDGYVQNSFATEELNLLHIVCSDPTDMRAPKLIGLQMHDAEGKIKTVFNENEEAHLLVAMYDRNSKDKAFLDFDVKLYVAEQDSDNWTEVTGVDVEEYEPALGKSYDFTLATDGTLTTGKWLKLKVVGEDSTGNSNTMLLDYCLFIGDPNSVSAIDPDSNAAPVYYNLQGIRVANPAAGQLYIEKTGTTTRKILK